MIDAIASEIKLRSMDWKTTSFSTIYFGGGTPSLLSGEELNQLLETVKTNYQLDTELEITLESNPDDCSEDNLLAWKKIGINRLSIGIQSFESTQLDWMNRTHSSQEGDAAVQRAKSVGFSALTVDLMYGLPNLSTQEWRNQLQRIFELDVDHISAYCLTVEAKTPLDQSVKSKRISPSTNEEQSEQFEILVLEMEKHGFEQYEISNFARNDKYSKHNTAYWLGEKYVAFGPSAHGFTSDKRYWNLANNQVYMKSLEEGILPQTEEVLSKTDCFNELLLVGLRTKWGVEKMKLESLLDSDFSWRKRIDYWINEGKLLDTETHYVLTQSGKLLADKITGDLFQLKNPTL